MRAKKPVVNEKSDGRATVLDVARKAGVGASTVSRYLRGIRVRPSIAGRLEQAVRELSYQPNMMARSLRVGRSRTIGAVLPKTSNIFFSLAAQRMEEEVRSRGCTLLVVTHQDSAEQQRAQLAVLQRYRVDGVVFTATPGTSLEEVKTSLPGTPVVCFDSIFTPHLDAVVLRNQEAARVAVEHLRQHGHKKITCVSGRPEIFSFAERMTGYKGAMRSAGLTPAFVYARTYEEMRFMLGRALQAKDRPTALLSLSDFVTANMLMTFDEISLPADRRPAFIGFDDFGFAPYVSPPVTVVRQPIDLMVRYVLNLLFARIDGSAAGQVQTIALSGELVCRQSCGCH